MKKLFILSLSVMLTACASAQSEEPVVEAEAVSTERVVYRDYDNTRVFQEDNGAYRQYANGGRRTRVVRNTPVESYQPTSVVEEEYVPQSSSRPRRIMEDSSSQEVYNQPRRRAYVSNSSSSRPNCISRGRSYQAASGSSCPDQIRETREPVEVVYKKTTYRTVFQPKTYTDVSYEKEPYRAGRTEEVLADDVVSSDYDVKTTTTTTTEYGE